MKKLKLIAAGFLLIFATSCDNAGKSRVRLKGDEYDLPEELKGLKVYDVATGNGGEIKVAILDNKINSTTYPVGKYQSSTIILNKQNNKVIEVTSVLMENDSLIVCRK